ncbi:unnamed protein product, partial [Brugia timori]|uniref:Uncharacterized protein n=1 Tax=Brugia timori TaxID=42155 RepID=A0A0R3QF27_9BILA
MSSCRLPNEKLDANYWTQSGLLMAAANCTEKTERCRYRECQLRNESMCRFGYIYDLSEIKYSAINRCNLSPAVVFSTCFEGFEGEMSSEISDYIVHLIHIL